jgi:hypothetical protein
MPVSSSVYIGAGITNPTRPLDVNGEALFRDKLNLIGSSTDPANNLMWYMAASSDGTTPNNQLSIYQRPSDTIGGAGTSYLNLTPTALTLPNSKLAIGASDPGTYTLYANGPASITGAVALGSTLNVTGAQTLTGATYHAGNVTISGSNALYVAGASSLMNGLRVNGAITVTSGSLDVQNGGNATVRGAFTVGNDMGGANSFKPLINIWGNGNIKWQNYSSGQIGPELAGSGEQSLNIIGIGSPNLTRVSGDINISGNLEANDNIPIFCANPTSTTGVAGPAVQRHWTNVASDSTDLMANAGTIIDVSNGGAVVIPTS